MKSVFAFFIFSVFAYPCVSQHILFGPKVGIQTSKAFYDEKSYYETYESQMVIAYHAGVVSNIKVTDLFSLHAEVLYNQTAKKIKGQAYNVLHTERYQLITVPLLLRSTFRQGYHQYYINIGPDISYWIGGSGKIRTDELMDYNMQELPYQLKLGKGNREFDVFYIEKPTRILLGLDVGVGAMLPVRDQFLMLDLRYTWGHTNLGKSNTDAMGFLYYDNNLAHANQVLSFSVAYLFEFDFFAMLKGKSISKP